MKVGNISMYIASFKKSLPLQMSSFRKLVREYNRPWMWGSKLMGLFATNFSETSKRNHAKWHLRTRKCENTYGISSSICSSRRWIVVVFRQYRGETIGTDICDVLATFELHLRSITVEFDSSLIRIPTVASAMKKPKKTTNKLEKCYLQIECA